MKYLIAVKNMPSYQLGMESNRLVISDHIANEGEIVAYMESGTLKVGIVLACDAGVSNEMIDLLSLVYSIPDVLQLWKKVEYMDYPGIGDAT